MTEPKSKDTEPKEEQASEREHRETGNPPMLVLKPESESLRAFAYAFLLHCEFASDNGEDVIGLEYGFCQVEISGLKLAEIFKLICEHHLKYLPAISPEEVAKYGGGVRAIHVFEQNETQVKGA